jgi:hypothetical protein
VTWLKSTETILPALAHLPSDRRPFYSCADPAIAPRGSKDQLRVIALQSTSSRSASAGSAAARKIPHAAAREPWQAKSDRSRAGVSLVTHEFAGSCAGRLASLRGKAANVSMHGGDSQRERVRKCHACPILGLRAPVLLALDGCPSFLRHTRLRSRASAFGAHGFGSFEVGAQEEKQE